MTEIEMAYQRILLGPNERSKEWLLEYLADRGRLQEAETLMAAPASDFAVTKEMVDRLRRLSGGRLDAEYPGRDPHDPDAW